MEIGFVMADAPHVTQRFSDRVADYVRYRPGYPRDIVTTLAAECGLTPASVIADIGCGPGNLARIFLDNGNRVIGVEPNGPMRAAGVREMAWAGARFEAVDGTAENTGLAPNSADFITAGQAFHWFEPDKARTEFLRILRPGGGWCALVWNEHHRASAFLDAYDGLLRRYGTDYAEVRGKRNAAKDVERFFAPQTVERREFTYRQHFDYEGLRGRLESSSYAPRPGQAAYAPMMAELRELFGRSAADGRVAFEYETFLYYGRLSRD